jgi:predicted DCC family thiol-disulfide oxidoreductase YuxK
MGEAVFELYYDGQCPLCSREVAALRRMDHSRKLRFSDIAADGFQAATLGLSQAQLMARIHGRTPAGELVEGVEVFRRVYAALGFERLVAASRWPGVRSLLDASYTLFARNRLRLTGRCDAEACRR